MATRPALVALGCRSCQNAIYGAVLRSSTPALRSFPQYTRQRTLQLAVRRPFSTDHKDSPSGTIDSSRDTVVEDVEEDSESAPWFLEEEPPRHPPSHHKPTLPKVPEGAPDMLDPMLQYVYEDMGLDDLSMLDLRDLDPQASLGPNLIMLFGTARSERHLHISSGRFVRWLRRNHNVGARAEGLIGPGELKTKLRRLRKKAKLMGQNTAVIPGGDNGISTGWVCVNFRITDDSSVESARFDEDGSFSGFGAPQNATTIVVQCMTEARRQELDLEKLWKDILRRNLDQQVKIRGEHPDAEKLDKLLASKLQLHEAPGTSQFEAMERASQQNRYFSTSARRLQEPLSQETANKEGSMSTAPPKSETNLLHKDEHREAEVLRQEIFRVQVEGAAMDGTKLESLVSAVLAANRSAGIAADDRLALVDQLLHTGAERGLDVGSQDILVTLIEALVTSPVYGPELSRAQENFEMLLRESGVAPSMEHTGRLMNAYAHRKDWDRFWDIFRTRPRFNLHRDTRLYDLAFRTMAATRDAAMCIEALRWVYAEMLAEQPPVDFHRLYSNLRSCILLADPSAEQQILNNTIMDEDVVDEYKGTVLYPEFVRILREVESLRISIPK